MGSVEAIVSAKLCVCVRPIQDRTQSDCPLELKVAPLVFTHFLVWSIFGRALTMSSRFGSLVSQQMAGIESPHLLGWWLLTDVTHSSQHIPLILGTVSLFILLSLSTQFASPHLSFLCQHLWPPCRQLF